MNAKQVAVYEVDGRHIHMVPEGLADYVAGIGTEFADMGPVAVPGDLLPLRWSAYRAAAALLSVYRSRVDFLRHHALDTGAESPRYRFARLPSLTGLKRVAFGRAIP
jgi:hypothetical protein